MNFCTSCGKQLLEGQVCECITAKAAATGFCTSCGKQLFEGHVCDCGRTIGIGRAVTVDKTAIAELIESMKNRMGIGDPERNATDTYERGMKIVPECIRANENEIPVKQYNVAVLRNLLRFERAEGRIQVTNKRVIFRAAGRSIGGRTTMQQEFAIDEIAGLEGQRGYRFSFFHLICGILLINIAAAVGMFPTRLFGAPYMIVGFLFGIGGLVSFFIIKRKFLLKLLLLGISLGSFSAITLALPFMSIFSLISFIVTSFGLFLYVLRPDFAIIVKNKSALEQSPPIHIRRSRGFWAWRKDSGTGFSEVMPTPESEGAIREIGAIINDIQKLGDLGVKKWLK